MHLYYLPLLFVSLTIALVFTIQFVREQVHSLCVTLHAASHDGLDVLTIRPTGLRSLVMAISWTTVVIVLLLMFA